MIEKHNELLILSFRSLMDDYRHRKEAFVSNLNGTTLFETGSIVSNICASYFLCQVLKHFIPYSKIKQSSLLNFLFEYFILVIPMVSVCTVLSSISHIFHILIWLMAFGLYSISQKSFSQISTEQNEKQHSRTIEVFRAQIMIVTCLCILAVDFPIFPRRFAKTENFGYSGMDLGVGLFAIAHGMVSYEARTQSNSFKSKSNVYLKRILIENMVLLLLGLIRLCSVKMFSYVEHVSEYGIHWNFFLTLCAMKLLAMLLFRVFSSVNYLPLLIFLTMTFHEFILLRFFGFDSYLIESSTGRTNFIDANREGIFSLSGYVTLYLIGIYIGRLAFDGEYHRRKTLLPLLIAAILLCSLDRTIGGEPSRKLCNLAYISSTTGLACMCMFGFGLIRSLLLTKYGSDDRSATESVLLKAINEKGLDIFLLANVLTGLINLNVNTLDTSSFISYLLISFYMVVITAFAYFCPSLIKKIMGLVIISRRSD